MIRVKRMQILASEFDPHSVPQNFGYEPNSGKLRK